jgi:hypothetical protein
MISLLLASGRLLQAQQLTYLPWLLMLMLLLLMLLLLLLRLMLAGAAKHGSEFVCSFMLQQEVSCTSPHDGYRVSGE